MNDASFDMLTKLIHGQYDPWEFTFDFPMETGNMLHVLYDADAVSGRAYDDLIEACAWFDPYDTGDPYTIDEKEFRAKAKVAYDEAMRVLAKKAV